MILPYTTSLTNGSPRSEPRSRRVTGASCRMREAGRRRSGSMTSSGSPLIGGTAMTGARSNGASTRCPTSRPKWKASSFTSFMWKATAPSRPSCFSPAGRARISNSSGYWSRSQRTGTMLLSPRFLASRSPTRSRARSAAMGCCARAWADDPTVRQRAVFHQRGDWGHALAVGQRMIDRTLCSASIST